MLLTIPTFPPAESTPQPPFPSTTSSSFSRLTSHLLTACCPCRRNLASAFRTQVINSKETDAASLVPVRQLGDASLIYLRASNVYLLAITKRNSNAMMVMQFLSRVRVATA